MYDTLKTNPTDSWLAVQTNTLKNVLPLLQYHAFLYNIPTAYYFKNNCGQAHQDIMKYFQTLTK